MIKPTRTAIAVAMAIESRQEAHQFKQEAQKWHKPKPGFVSRLLGRLKRKGA